MSCKLSPKETYYTNRWIVHCSDCIVCMLSFCVDWERGGGGGGGRGGDILVM